MDGSTIDHSDSDSGESWTLLEPSPAYGEDAPELCNNRSASTHDRDTAVTNIEKDDDTDGISVISDSDPESTPCEVTCDSCQSEENYSQATNQQHNHPYISVNSFPPNDKNDNNKYVRTEDDFLGDGSGKHKTYVHRRNKRLSTVLNIIMLGSVITAAGVAIGHMWGARNECPMHTTPSVNKILSNLYKLQEENSYLRNKLKEITVAGNLQLIQQRKAGSEKTSLKQPRCKKIYEEPLNSKRSETVMKCVDSEINKSVNPITQMRHDKELLNYINKLENNCQHNKTWLEEEIDKSIGYEEQLVKKRKDYIKITNTIKMTEESNKYKDENLKKQLESENNEILTGPLNTNKLSADKKISYADSLKTDQAQNKRSEKTANDDVPEKRIKENYRKQNKNNMLYQNSYSEDDFKKDDRYIAPKVNKEKKKRDRQKLHKNQKRRNKYEQWEMKGGYMKDYDELSIGSSQENEYKLKKPDKNFLSRDFERNNYIHQFTENDRVETIKKPVDEITKSEKNPMKFDKGNEKDKKNMLNWYEKRAADRADARKKLEFEMFGETSPNNAGWYFRRMQKREQCRAQGDNSTFRKLSKRRMNFRMKH